MDLKICKHCNQLKSFYPSRPSKCKDCLKQYQYQWTNENKDRWLDIVRESKKKSYHRHKDKIAVWSREWREQNPDRVKELYRLYREQNPHVYSLHRKLRETKVKTQTPPWANPKEINKIYKEARLKGLEVDHIIPLQGKNVSGLHVETNLQLLSLLENRKKSNKYECDNSQCRY